jgi:V/A-type H+/Na+-transporting ATPase subunit K
MSPDSLNTVAAVATHISSNMALYTAWIGMFFMVALSGLGSAIGTVMDGQATIAALKKKDDVFANCMILSALPGTQGLYGFGAFFLIKGKMDAVIQSTGFLSMQSAAAILGAGMIVGLVCWLSAIQQGKVVATGIESIGNGNDVFSKTLVLAVYPELYAIISFATAFLISTGIK